MSVPSSYDIAIAAATVPDYCPAAELAKTVCMLRNEHPYDRRTVAGINMACWQARIAEAQFMSLLGVGP